MIFRGSHFSSSVIGIYLPEAIETRLPSPPCKSPSSHSIERFRGDEIVCLQVVHETHIVVCLQEALSWSQELSSSTDVAISQASHSCSGLRWRSRPTDDSVIPCRSCYTAVLSNSCNVSKLGSPPRSMQSRTVRDHSSRRHCIRPLWAYHLAGPRSYPENVPGESLKRSTRSNVDPEAAIRRVSRA